MRRTLALILLALSTTFVLAPHAQQQSEPPQHAPSVIPAAQQPANSQPGPATLDPPRSLPGQSSATRPTSTPYTGDLSVFEDPNRDRLLQINRVMDTLHLHPGSTVADIGAGGGWFSVRAARRVGPSGHVFAEDINPKAIQAIGDRLQREHLPQITPILGTPDNPNLPPNSLNAALMLRVYHEVANTPACSPTSAQP